MNENEKKLALINVLGIEIIGIILCYLALKNNNGSDLSVFMWIYVGFAIFIEWKIGWLKWIIKISDTVGRLITPLFYFISGLGYILSIVCGLLVTLGGIYISSAYFVFTFPIYALYCMYKKDFSDIMIYKGNINLPEDAKEANGETINNEVTNTENISGNINLKKDEDIAAVEVIDNTTDNVTSVNSTDDKVTCLSCGAKNANDAKLCTACENPLKAEDDLNTENATEIKNRL